MKNLIPAMSFNFFKSNNKNLPTMNEILESLNIQGCKVQLYLNVFFKTLQPLCIVSIIACPILRLRVHALMRTLVHASVCACVGALSFCLPLFCRYGNAINHSFMTKPRIRTEVEKKQSPKKLDQKTSTKPHEVCKQTNYHQPNLL